MGTAAIRLSVGLKLGQRWLVALFGNLEPHGAIVKLAACDPALFEKQVRAVVFSSLEDLAARVDDAELGITVDDFMALQNAGPKRSASGMPGASNIPIPRKLSAAGVKDMVRISDARMSGTAFGTIVLNVSPEAAVGGALATLHTGNRIRLSVHDQKMEFSVDGAELKRRQAPSFRTIVPPQKRGGYDRLLSAEVTHAKEGHNLKMLKPIRMNDDPLEKPAPGVQGP